MCLAALSTKLLVNDKGADEVVHDSRTPNDRPSRPVPVNVVVNVVGVSAQTIAVPVFNAPVTE
jgi:hypothetical protein